LTRKSNKSMKSVPKIFCYVTFLYELCTLLRICISLR
jgi:hypothetical protein